ncbi:hypothetical protein AGMMS49982_20350 [Bacteroidia bacterium]|nr:hypothetical protein AGMMS49982_20350 [Bacteroidia bacterium]
MQTNLFGEIEHNILTVEGTAAKVGVSSATVRNWIKTGYLNTSSNGKILSTSVDFFISEIAGKNKLNARANKLQKDEHDHDLLSKQIENELNTEHFDDSVGQKYESSLSESFRNKEGIYYTPAKIVTDMMLSISDVENKTFLDPCCGGGNFIMQAVTIGFKPENVYGFDTDINAVEITKKRILDKTGCKTNNIIHSDFFKFTKEDTGRFDYIFTNPPWGKKLPKEEREKYAIIYHSGKSIDTCSLFFFACLNKLNVTGKLGFLLPEAFFNISTFEDARKRALELQIERLIDYGKPFKGLLTRAQAIILKNEKSLADETVDCESENLKFSRDLESFRKTPKHIFNLWAKSEVAEVIDHVFSVPHITLQGNAV